MDFSETIEVKVVDKEDSFSVDSYFFAYFHDLPGALDQMRDAVRTHRMQSNTPEGKSPPVVLDTTVSRLPFAQERPTGTNPEALSSKATSGFRLSSLFRPFSDTSTTKGTSVPPSSDFQNDDYTHISRKPDSSSFIPVASPESIISPLPRHLQEQSDSPIHQSTQSIPTSDHTYPPSTSNSSIFPNKSSLSRDSSGSWGVGVPSWLKTPRKVLTSLSGTDSSVAFTTSPVKEVYSSAVSSPGPISRSSGGLGDMAFSVLETPDILPDQEMTEKFRAAFAYDEKETLLGCKLIRYCA